MKAAFICYYCEHLAETKQHDYDGARFELGQNTILSLCKLCYQAIGYHYLRPLLRPEPVWAKGKRR